MSTSVVFSKGTLSADCPTTWQGIFEWFIDALGGTVDGVQWVASQSAPADLTKYWLKLDAQDRPVGAYHYSAADSGWITWQQQVIFGTVGGGSGAMTLTNLPAMTAATAYQTGRLYVLISNQDVPGATTLNIDGLGAKSIKKHSTDDLEASDVRNGQVFVVSYNGTEFDLITPPLPPNEDSRQRSSTNITFPTMQLDISVTKPSGKWRRLRMDVAGYIYTGPTKGFEVTATGTWQTAPETGNSLSASANTNIPSTVPNLASNHPEQGAEVCPSWWWEGDVPATLEDVNTITVRLDFTGTNILDMKMWAGVTAVYS